MKKSILTLVIMAVSAMCFAQKPAEGNLLTEANFSLSNFNDNFTLPALRFRYFIADDMAVRADVSVNGNSSTNNFAENFDGTGSTGSQEIKNSGFGIGLGVEKHFGGNSRFSPYAVVGFNFMSGSNTETWTDFDGAGYAMDFTGTIEGGNSSFGVMAGLGADYWIGNSFYVGTELGFGFSSNTTKEGTTTTNAGGGAADIKLTTPEAKSSSFGEMIVPAFRIGFTIN